MWGGRGEGEGVMVEGRLEVGSVTKNHLPSAGQLLQIANDFYSLQLQVTVMGEEVVGGINCVSYRWVVGQRKWWRGITHYS